MADADLQHLVTDLAAWLDDGRNDTTQPHATQEEIQQAFENYRRISATRRSHQIAAVHYHPRPHYYAERQLRSFERKLQERNVKDTRHSDPTDGVGSASAPTEDVGSAVAPTGESYHVATTDGVATAGAPTDGVGSSCATTDGVASAGAPRPCSALRKAAQDSLNKFYMHGHLDPYHYFSLRYNYLHASSSSCGAVGMDIPASQPDVPSGWS